MKMKSAAAVLLLASLLLAGYLFSSGEQTYTDQVRNYQFAYPKGWVLTQGPTNDGFHFEIVNGEKTSFISADIQYITLEEVEKNYTDCHGDCPSQQPLVVHVRVANADALKITNFDPASYPVYYVPVSTVKEPLAVLVIQITGDPSNFHVLDTLIQSLRKG